MKKFVLSVFVLLILSLTNSIAQDPKFGTLLTTKIKLAELKQTCYSSYGSAAAIKAAAKQKQPIVNPEQAYLLFTKLFTSVPSTVGDVNAAGLPVSTFTDYSKDKDKAVIFLLHPIDLSKFEQEDNSTKKAELTRAYSTNAANKTTYLTSITDLEALAGKYISNLKAGATAIPPRGGAPVPLTLDEQGKNASYYNDVQTQIITLKRRIEEIDEQNLKYLSEYNNLFNQYIEDKEVKIFVLHNAEIVPPFQNSEYLSQISDFLIVTLGGPKDLANLTVKITKKTSAFISSINSGTEIISDVTGLRFGKIQGNMPATLAAPPEPEIPINFTRLVKGTLKAPYDISLEIPGQASIPTYSVHEINRFLLTFGFSAKYIQPREFVAAGTSVTVEEPSKDLQNTIRGDLFAMIDWCPWGRDLEKLNENNSKERRLERLSFALGVKVSKDPLQSIFFGPAYHLGKDIRVFAGPSFNTIPKEGATLAAVSLNAGQDYLYRNIDREFKISFMLGLSFSPTGIKSIIGSNKKE
jgi:hypothetical protein